MLLVFFGVSLGKLKEYCKIRNKCEKLNLKYPGKLLSLSVSTGSLDFVTEWLQEAADDLKSKLPLALDDGSTPTRKDPPLCPVAVQNHAYLKLLKWDHLQKPFPEVTLC